jgi:hypothetical protein
VRVGRREHGTRHIPEDSYGIASRLDPDRGMRVTRIEQTATVNGQSVTVQRRFRKNGLNNVTRGEGSMVDKCQRETILKTDRRNLFLEIGLDGKFSVKSSGWDENRILLDGDALEIAVDRGRWVMTHVPAKPRGSSVVLVERYFPTE